MSATAHAYLNLLIVEDDAILSKSLRALIPSDYKVFVASSAELVPDHVFFHVAFVDMHLSKEPNAPADGPLVIASLIARNPSIEVISMSGDLNRDNMHAAIKAGAQKFLSKPLNPEEVLLLLSKSTAYWQIRNQLGQFENNYILLGSSKNTDELKKQIAQLKGEPHTVLIEGETGTGKEIVARSLNQQEGLRPFIAVNCSAIPEHLFESQFFGHTKGSFTGADQNKLGYIEAAQGGDLFLDEIEALPLTQQAKLLRFLESFEFMKVGDKQVSKAQVRVICASNESLKEKVKNKEFREDLYFRIAAQTIYIKPLKERLDDIEELSVHFLKSQQPKRNKSFSNEAIQELKKYTWPGNVRELKRVCEQLVLTSALPIIEKHDVSNLLQRNSFNSSILQNYDLTLKCFLDEQEKAFLAHHVEQFKASHGSKNIDELCEKLDISKSSFYKKIKDYGLNL